MVLSFFCFKNIRISEGKYILYYRDLENIERYQYHFRFLILFNMDKLILFLGAYFRFISFFLSLFFSVRYGMGAPYIVFELDTGKVVRHQHAFQRWYPASLTKLMTAYVAFRVIESGAFHMDSPIWVSHNAARQPSNKMGCKPGSALTLDNAFKMILTLSSNDIAVAIAENIFGSTQAFVERMNFEAQRLGMYGTRYANPSGLFDKNQFTTARDQALLVRAIRYEFPQYSHYFSLEGISYNRKNIENFNYLLGRYGGVDGMKTGFICESGFNLVASALRDERSLAVVLLGEESSVQRSYAATLLLDEGFLDKTGFSVTIDTLPFYGKNTESVSNLRKKVCSLSADRHVSPQEEQEALKNLKVRFSKEISRDAYFSPVTLLFTPQKMSPSSFPMKKRKHHKKKS